MDDERKGTFSELTLENRRHLKILHDEWQIILEKFNSSTIETITPEIIEELYPIIRKGTRWNKKRRRFAIMLLGYAIGFCVKRDLSFDWIQYKDKLGEEIALKHTIKDSYAYPFSSVEKRIKKNEYGYFVGLYAMLKSTHRT